MGEASVGCFGKLPIAGDFLRVNAGGPEVADLDQWIQEGLSVAKAKLGPGWERAFDVSAPQRFVYTPDKADRTLVGVMAPSRDRTGRRYPLCIFLRVDREQRSGGASWLPIRHARWFDRALDLARAGSADNDAKAFLARVEQLADQSEDAVGTRADVASQWETRTVGEFVGNLFGDEAGSRAAALGGALDALAPVLRAEGARLNFGVKYPVSRDGAGDVAFWCELSGRLAGRDLGEPFLFWSSRPAPERSLLLASFRRPTPKTWLSFLDPDYDDEWWYDLAPSAAAQTPSAGAQSALWANRSRSMSSLLSAAEAAL